VGEVSYKGHRYPAEIIAHCVWLYHRFPLSFPEVEGRMLGRGVIVTYETIRQWCNGFTPGVIVIHDIAGGRAKGDGIRCCPQPQGRSAQWWALLCAGVHGERRHGA
jgi:hypothetical protein